MDHQEDTNSSEANKGSYFYRTRVRSLFTLVTNSLTDWLTDWLTHSCLVNLIDVTLACEDANLKLVEVVTVADVDAEDHVGNSLLQIWEVTFGPKATLLFRLWARQLPNQQAVAKMILSNSNNLNKF